MSGQDVVLGVIVLVGGLSCLAAVMAGRWLYARSWAQTLVAYGMGLPANLRTEQVSAWLGAVSAGSHAPGRSSLLPPPPVVLEVVATDNGIEHILLMPRSMHEAVLSSVRAHLPGTSAEERPEYMAARASYGFAVEALLSSRRRPLADERAVDSSAGLLTALQPLRRRERICLQWILTGAGTPRPVRSTSARDRKGGWPGGSTTADEARAQRQKDRAPLLHGCLRVGITAVSRERAYSLFGRVWGAYRMLNAAGAQVVRRPLPTSMVAGRMARLALPITSWPFVLNSHEAAGFVGLPVDGLRPPGLVLGGARQLPPPPFMPRRGAIVGLSNYPGMTTRPLGLLPNVR